MRTSERQDGSKQLSGPVRTVGAHNPKVADSVQGRGNQPLPSPHLPLGLRRGGVGEEACCATVVKGAAAASSAACSASFRYGTLPGPPGQPAGAQLLLGACEQHRAWQAESQEPGACDGRDVIAAALLSVLQQQTLPGDAGRLSERA